MKHVIDELRSYMTCFDEGKAWCLKANEISRVLSLVCEYLVATGSEEIPLGADLDETVPPCREPEVKSSPSVDEGKEDGED